MNPKDKAEQYVRSQLPELMELSFGCECTEVDGRRAIFLGEKVDNGRGFNWPYCFLSYIDGEPYTLGQNYAGEIIGHPIQLQHWLRVLEKSINGCEAMLSVDGMLYEMRNEKGWDAGQYRHYLGIDFNLTTGQPATEADYQAFCNIVGV